MGLENAEFIHQLNEEWPTPEDFRREGDDHLRMIKGTLKRTFPNVNGEVLLSHNQLNALLDYIGDVEENIISALGAIPVGGIILWSGAIGAIPTGWLLCNGQNGTPDLRDRFVMGAGSGATPGNIGGAASVTVPEYSHSHGITVNSHALTAAQIPAHSHGGFRKSNFQRYGGIDSGLVAPGETGDQGSTPEVPATPDTSQNSVATSVPITQETGGSAGHSHGASSASSTRPQVVLENRPPYYALAYIMRATPITVPPITKPGP